MLGFGCNPGMVSIWAQVGVRMINDYYKNATPKTPEELGIRTVHISEVDTQRSKKPKDKDEYCNTWASTAEPFYEEALAPLELTLGTHEDLPTKNVVYYDKKNTVLIMDCIAKNVLAQSYTPLFGNFTGMLIRHEENVTIGEKLSTYAEVRGKKIKTYKTVDDWIKEYMSSMNYFAFFSKPQQSISALAKIAQNENIEVGIFQY